MNAAVYAPKWYKALLLMLAGCSATTATPPQPSYTLQACQAATNQRQAISFEFDNQRWELQHLIQGRSIKAPGGPYSGNFHPFGAENILFEVTLKNIGDTPIYLDEQSIELISTQDIIPNMPRAQLLKNWPLPSPDNAEAVQLRSLALTDILLRGFGSRTILPGRSSQGILVFPIQKQVLQKIRLKTTKNQTLALCKQGLEIMAQKEIE
jgi:hypothetical protein